MSNPKISDFNFGAASLRDYEITLKGGRTIKTDGSEADHLRAMHMLEAIERIGPNLSYAYCSTAVGAQGATVAKAFAYIDERACQQNGYVAASRSTAETVLFASKVFDGKGKDTNLKTLGRALSVDKCADYSLD